MNQTLVKKTTHFLAPCVTVAMALCLLPGAALAGYVQFNLVSNVPGLAAFTDPNLKNPWGVSFSGTSPFWVSDTGTNVSTLYSGTGAINARVVSVPGGPTGEVSNSAGAGNFIDGAGPASFIFDTISGGIYAWDSANGNNAQLEATTAGAVFTGLAIDNNGAGNFLYAANNAGSGAIDVFNSSFASVTPAGNFVDPNLPAGYVPFNVQTIGTLLYVEYDIPSGPPGANGRPATRTLGDGVVSVFDANGNFVKELIGPGGQLDAPWGIVVAPSGFGAFGGDLLVGNFGNGEINAFNPTSGAFLGTLSTPGGTPIVNQDLWALEVRPAGAFNHSAVYFTAGIDGQRDGLLGDLVNAPEPSSLALVGLGWLALVSRRKLASLIRK